MKERVSLVSSKQRKRNESHPDTVGMPDRETIQCP